MPGRADERPVLKFVLQIPIVKVVFDVVMLAH